MSEHALSIFSLMLCEVHIVELWDQFILMTVDFSSQALIAIVATLVGFSLTVACDHIPKSVVARLQKRND